MPRFEHAPQERIDDHPELLAEVVRDCCGWEPEEYAVSDESLLSDLVGVDEDLDALYATVRERYGITVTPNPQPYLWQIIDKIAQTRRAAGRRTGEQD